MADAGFAGSGVCGHQGYEVKDSPTEQKIVSIAQAIAVGASPESIRENLIKEGFSEYGAFLSYKAAETYILMLNRTGFFDHEDMT